MVLNIIYYILFVPCFLFAVYYAFLALVGLIFRKQKYKMQEDKEKFCIFVPCHNEEPVISATVENLLNINYNPELFDIFFIADNCADKTADKIRETIAKHGAKNFFCLERNVNDPNKRGKPHALRWGIDLLEEDDKFYNKYTQFMILDADNFVDPDILKHINSQYLSYKESKRPVMIQTYLDSKNKNNLIARGYYASYRISNGFFQLPLHKLGLVPAIGGTGFSMSTQFLKDIGGYNCTSLVEDLEIQTIATLRGKRVVYNHNTRIYDEKPTGVKQSIVQKSRWSQGHWFVFFKYAGRLLLRMLNPKEIKYFFKRLHMVTYLSAMLHLLLGVISTIYTFVLICCGVAIAVPAPLIYINLGIGLFMFLIIPISSILDGPKQEKKRVLLEFIPNFIAIIIASLIYSIANIIGFFNCGNQKVWRKTAHKVTAMSDKNKPDSKPTEIVVEKQEERGEK